jgi:hypothetical protein
MATLRLLLVAIVMSAVMALLAMALIRRGAQASPQALGG